MSNNGKKLVQFKKGSAEGSLSCKVCATSPTNSCLRLGGIANGTIGFSHNHLCGNNLPEGTKATYQCNTNHTLFRGNLNRYCMPNGKWSGEEPRCEIKRNKNFSYLNVVLEI